MRGAMPNEESVILLMGKTAMDKKSYLRQAPRIDLDKNLFPDGQTNQFLHHHYLSIFSKNLNPFEFLSSFTKSQN